MKHLEKMCLSCHFFRPKSATEGICRLDKGRAPDYPKTAIEACCEKWQTSGQQYYIRAGWVKNQAEREETGKAG